MRPWLLAAALLASPAAAEAFCRTRTVAQTDPTRCAVGGGALFWPGGCVSLHVNPAVTAPNIPGEQLRVLVEEASRAWKTVACDPVTRAAPTFELVVGADRTDPVGYEEGKPNSNMVTWRARWGDDAYHDPRAAAITIVTFGSRSANILDADTELNVRALFPFSLDGAPGTTDLRTVVVHELGHTMGLAHSADRNAVMWFTAGQGERRRTPNADDVAGLCAVYPPSRVIRCDPEVRTESLEGGGLACAAAVGRGSRVVPLALLGVGLAGLRRRRRRRVD